MKLKMKMLELIMKIMKMKIKIKIKAILNNILNKCEGEGMYLNPTCL